jgi:hypothetical protein
MALSFMPCGDAWSIDRLRRIRRGLPVPDADTPSRVYAMARYVCWVPIVLTYTSAGFSKLRGSGIGWVNATNMKTLLFEQSLYQRAGNYSISLHLADAPDIVFVLLGIAAVASESFYITVLFSRTCRRIMPAITGLMHIGIVFLMNIVFLDLILLQFVFYVLDAWFTKASARLAPFSGWVRRLQSQISHGGPVTAVRRSRSFVLACGLAIAAVGTAQLYVWTNRIEYYPFTSVQMFITRPQTVVTYFKTIGHWESGRVGPIQLEDTLPVMSINSRYEMLLDRCFNQSGNDRPLCDKMLSILGDAYNKKVPVGSRLTQLDLQRWKWDFAAQAGDPNFGAMELRVIGDVNPDGGVRAASGVTQH